MSCLTILWMRMNGFFTKVLWVLSISGVIIIQNSVFCLVIVLLQIGFSIINLYCTHRFGRCQKSEVVGNIYFQWSSPNSRVVSCLNTLRTISQPRFLLVVNQHSSIEVSADLYQQRTCTGVFTAWRPPPFNRNKSQLWKNRSLKRFSSQQFIGSVTFPIATIYIFRIL